MDAATLKAIDENPAIKEAVEILVRSCVLGVDRGCYGETGIRLILSGKKKPVRFRQVVDLAFEKN